MAQNSHFNQSPLFILMILIVSWHFGDVKLIAIYEHLLVWVIINNIQCTKSTHYKWLFKVV